MTGVFTVLHLEAVLMVTKIPACWSERHNHLEKNHVYKWANVLLAEAERLSLTSRISPELNNMLPRFKI
jgi:hypothetical protein